MYSANACLVKANLHCTYKSYIDTDKLVKSHILPGSHYWTAACNASQKHEGISNFNIHKAFNILHSKFCLSLFFEETSTAVYFLQFETNSDTNTLGLRNAVLLSETNPNHVNTKALRVNMFVKKANI